MASIQRMTLIILIISSAARGEIGFVLEKSGFMGEVAIGGIYSWHEKHAVEMSLGQYTIDGDRYMQLNLGYRLSPWEMDIPGVLWRPVEFGVFGLGALGNSKYFLQSPAEYPSKNYYDQNAVRLGVQFGSTTLFNRFGISYHFIVLDTGLAVLYNNPETDLRYFWASGVSIQIYFSD